MAVDAGLRRLARPEEIRAILIGAATAGVSLTYSQVLEQFGLVFSRPKMRALCALLGEVDRLGAARDEPELAVLVVRQSDGLPGQGWWVAGGGRDRGYHGAWEGPEAQRFIARVQADTFAFWQCRNGAGGSLTGD
jgi:hypothetical protein